MDILQLIDRLEELFNDAKAVPFTHNVVVDEDRMLELIDQMRIAIPEEVKKAQQVMAQRDRVMAQAQEEANRTLQLSRDKAEQLIERDMIVQEAQRRAEQILSQARSEAEATRADADNYVVDTLMQLQDQISKLSNQVANGIRMVQEDQMRNAIKEKFEELGKELPAYKHITGFTLMKEKLPITVLGKIKRYEVQKKYMAVILEEEEKKEALLSEEERILAESDIGRKVIACIKEALDIKTPIKLSDSIELDLGADSLGIIELASGLEKRFGLKIDEYISKKGISTVKDLILKVKDFVEEQKGEKNG